MKTEYLEYLGVVAFAAAVIAVMQADPAGGLYGAAQLVGGMALTAASAPCIGFAIRRIITGKGVEEPVRLYTLLVAIGLLITSAALGLTMLAEMPEWKILGPIGTGIVGLTPVLSLFIEVE